MSQIAERHIIVISHRRSGTHLTIDTIRNNFEKYAQLEYYNIDRIFHPTTHKKYITFNELKNELAKGPRVLKTHLLPNFDIYANDAEKEFLSKLLKKSKKIYVVRDGKDVMVSLFNYMKIFDPKIRSIGFSEFLRTDNEFDRTRRPMSRPKFWRFHITEWLKHLEEESLVLRFKEIKQNYVTTLDRISEFIGVPRNKKLIDIRRTKQVDGIEKLTSRFKVRKYKCGKNITSIAFRQGNIGEGKQEFSEADLEFFESETKGVDKILQTLDDAKQ